jgi:uncharacterized membrane protein
LCLIAAALLGAFSGLYDKYLLSPVSEGGLALNRLTVQSYFNYYQLAIMFVVIWLERKGSKQSSSFQWRWTIPFISLFICAADLAYFYSLSLDDSMISVVSMVRRGSVIISFLMGAFFFHERNLKSKAVDLVLVLLGLLLLYLGTAGY